MEGESGVTRSIIDEILLYYLRLLKGFLSICNYQVNASWVYGIFETGLIFDNIFATVDLTEIFHIGIIWFDIKIAHKNKILILP